MPPTTPGVHLCLVLLVSSSTHRHPAPPLAPPPARTRLPACLAGCACRGRPAPLPPLAPARPPVVVPACGGRLPPAGGPGCGWRMSGQAGVPHQCPRIGWLLAVPDCPHRGKPPAVPDWPGRLVLSVAVWIIKHPPAGPCPLGAATTGGEPPGMRGAPNRRCSRVPHAYPRNQLVTCPTGPPPYQPATHRTRPTTKRNTKNHQAPTRKHKEPETHQPPNPPNKHQPNHAPNRPSTPRHNSLGTQDKHRHHHPNEERKHSGGHGAQTQASQTPTGGAQAGHDSYG